MRKTIIGIAMTCIVMSCSKRGDLPFTQNPTDQTAKDPESCEFGIKTFNQVQRPLLAIEERKPPRGNTNTPPPPTGGSVILLDFDGAVVSGTAWNQSGTISCGPANLSTAAMAEIFERVSNDYSPFNVTITTSDSLYQTANPYKRTRVIITESHQWYGSTGGTAYVGSFGWGNNTPCFVFTVCLNYDTKKIAETVSHEAGHTLGLYHQAQYDNSCNMISPYHYGNGSGENGWAPIMGTAYYQNVTVWHNGAIAGGCNNVQDEIGIISSIVGGFRNDDHSNTISGATVLNADADGIIGTASDQDFFSLTIGASKTIEVLPVSYGEGNIGANVNLVLKVYNSNGALISTVDDPSTLGASIVLPAGQYFLSVNTTANQYASSYGLLGKYNIEVN